MSRRGQDRDAEFTEFVAARQVHLRRIAYAVCGDWHRAEDLLQISLTKLYLAWPRIHRAGGEEAYARQVIVRANIDEHRKRVRRPERPGLDGLEPSTPPDHAIEDRTDLVAALQHLPEMQRKVLVLRIWLDLSVRETASELAIGEGTVKSHLSRGVAALRRSLADQPG